MIDLFQRVTMYNEIIKYTDHQTTGGDTLRTPMYHVAEWD